MVQMLTGNELEKDYQKEITRAYKNGDKERLLNLIKKQDSDDAVNSLGRPPDTATAVVHRGIKDKHYKTVAELMNVIEIDQATRLLGNLTKHYDAPPFYVIRHFVQNTNANLNKKSGTVNGKTITLMNRLFFMAMHQNSVVGLAWGVKKGWFKKDNPLYTISAAKTGIKNKNKEAMAFWLKRSTSNRSELISVLGNKEVWDMVLDRIETNQNDTDLGADELAILWEEAPALLPSNDPVQTIVANRLDKPKDSIKKRLTPHLI